MLEEESGLEKIVEHFFLQMKPLLPLSPYGVVTPQRAIAGSQDGSSRLWWGACHVTSNSIQGSYYLLCVHRDFQLEVALRVEPFDVPPQLSYHARLDAVSGIRCGA